MKAFFVLFFFTPFSYGGMIEPCLAAQECRDLNDLKVKSSGNSIKCSEHGKCFYDLAEFIKQKDDNANFLKCVCDYGYTNNGNNDEVYCCYKQKEQFYAFILEIIPGFGLGHLYAGKTKYGWIKFGFMVGFFIIISINMCYLKRKRKGREINNQNLLNNNNNTNNNPAETITLTSKEMILTTLIPIILFIMTIWQIIDIGLYGVNFYKDGNNKPLSSW